MTNTKIFAEEILADEQLERVSGGTVAEFTEIYAALEKKAGAVGAVSEGLRTILDHIPGGKIGKSLWNNGGVRIAETLLKDCFGINSNMSIGWVGTGYRESGNIYSKNGKGLSHQEVLNIINAA